MEVFPLMLQGARGKGDAGGKKKEKKKKKERRKGDAVTRIEDFFLFFVLLIINMSEKLFSYQTCGSVEQKQDEAAVGTHHSGA